MQCTTDAELSAPKVVYWVFNLALSTIPNFGSEFAMTAKIGKMLKYSFYKLHLFLFSFLTEAGEERGIGIGVEYRPKLNQIYRK